MICLLSFSLPKFGHITVSMMPNMKVMINSDVFDTTVAKDVFVVEKLSLTRKSATLQIPSVSAVIANSLIGKTLRTCLMRLRQDGIMAVEIISKAARPKVNQKNRVIGSVFRCSVLAKIILLTLSSAAYVKKNSEARISNLRADLRLRDKIIMNGAVRIMQKPNIWRVVRVLPSKKTSAKIQNTGIS